MINQLFSLGSAVLIILITIIIFYPIIETWSGSVLAIVIAVLEIGVAFTVWLKYYKDQKKRKKYQIDGLCTTLCEIHKLVFRLYDYKFINIDANLYEEKKIMLEKKYFYHGESSYVSGDLLNMINREEMMRLNNDLLTKFLDECMKNEYDFKMYAYPFVVAVSNLITDKLKGHVHDDNSILKP